MKKFLALMMTLSLIIALAACGDKENSSSNGTDSKTESTASTAEKVEGKVALVTDVGTIDDESFNQATWEGIKAYCDANNVEYAYFQPTEDSNEARLAKIEEAVGQGYSIVVMPGFLFGEAVSEAQATYPEVKFLAVDVSEGDMTVPAEKNTHCIVFCEEQAGYLAGYAAVKDGYTKLGFLGGMAVPAVMRYGYGFVQGANAAAEELAKDIEVKYTYGGQFYGDANITAKMEGWYTTGTEIVFACGGGIYTSAVEAALNSKGYVIGVDVDQSPLGKSYDYNPFVTSAMKGLSTSVSDALATYFAGKWDTVGGTISTLGLTAGDYVGLPTSDEAWNFKTFTKDDYEAVKADIVSGKVVVSNNTDAQPTVGSHTTVNYID